MKKYLLTLLALALMLVLVAGCSGNSGNSESAQNSGPTIETEGSKGSNESGENTMGSDAATPLQGEWQANNVLVDSDSGKRVNVVLTIGDGATFTENVYNLDAEGNVINTETPDEIYKGTYSTDQDKMTLVYQEVTKDGKTATGQDVTSVAGVPGVEYTYNVSGNTMTWTDKDGIVYEFVKI